MKTTTKIMKLLPRSALFLLIFILICGVLYTGVVTGIAQVFFPDKANGSIIEVDGKEIRQRGCWHSSIPMMPICGAGL